MQYSLRFLLISFLFLLQFHLLQAQPDAMFRGTPDHNMVYTSKNEGEFNRLAWTFKTAAPVRSTVVTVGNALYFGSNDGWFYALNKQNGKLIWKTDCGSALSSSPAFSNGLIYVLSQQQNMIALDAKTGKIAWKKKIGDDKPYDWGFDYYFSSPTINGDTLFIASADGKMLAIHKKNGNGLWSFHAKHFFRTSPALATGWIYIGDCLGNFYALESSTGKLKWTFNTVGSPLDNDTIGFDRRAILSSAVIEGDNVVVGGRDGYLYNISRFTGELKWKFDHRFSWVISSPTIVDGEVITGTSDGHFVQSVNLVSGKETWRIHNTAPVWASPLVIGNQVYIGGNDGVLIGIDRKQGKRLAHPFCIDAKIFSSAVISDSLLYFGADDGVLYCIGRTAPGKLQRDYYVYWNNDKSFNFFRNGVDILLKDYLNRLGYAVIDRDTLAALVKRKKENGAGTVIAFVSQSLPSVLTRTDTVNMLHEFLQSGGMTVDLGNNALTISIDEKGGITPFQYSRYNSIVGVYYPKDNLTSMGGYFSCMATPAGRKAGMKPLWTGGSPVDPKSVDEVLGLDEKGRASSWIKRVGKGMFLQLNAELAFPENYHYLDEVIRYAETY